MPSNMDIVQKHSRISVDALSTSDIERLEYRKRTLNSDAKTCTKNLQDAPIILHNDGGAPPTILYHVQMDFHLIGEILKEDSIFMVETPTDRSWALFTTVGFWVQGRIRDEYARTQWQRVQEKLEEVAMRAGPDVRKDTLYRVSANTGVMKIFFYCITVSSSIRLLAVSLTLFFSQEKVSV